MSQQSPYWSDLVRSLQPYIPGEQPKTEQWLKLNTNENPFPPSPKVLAALHAAVNPDLRLYPDPEATMLRQALAQRYQVAADNVFVGNGSDEVLAFTFAALLKQQRPLLFADITYSFYPVYCGLFGIEYRLVALDDQLCIRAQDYCEHGDAANSSGLQRAGQSAGQSTDHCGGIVIANPNAPTGRALPLSAIEQIVAANSSCVVVVDEAYVDFGGQSAIGLTDRYPNLLVVHTMSKARSLAGLRVGYAIGAVPLIEALRRVKDSFNSYPLDRLAIAGALAAVQDDEYFEQTRHAVIENREWLCAQLRTLGLEVLPSAANFVFARHATISGASLQQSLRSHGVLVRHFNKPRIDQFLRITIGTRDQCQALVNAMRRSCTA